MLMIQGLRTSLLSPVFPTFASLRKGTKSVGLVLFRRAVDWLTSRPVREREVGQQQVHVGIVLCDSLLKPRVVYSLSLEEGREN